MEKIHMIAVNEFCLYYNVDVSFIHSLNQSGLIEITSIEEEVFVPMSELKHLEKLLRLNKEMDINLEGIETITYLMQRINDLQLHIVELNNKLAFYK